MGNVIFRYLLVVAFLGCRANTVWAGALSLEEQVQELIRQNQIQAQMIAELQQRMATLAVVEEPVVEQIEATAPSVMERITDRLALHLLMEVEGSAGDDFEGINSSNVSLATVEIGLDGQLSDWVQAHLLFLYEEGEENDHFIVDEGTITLGDLDEFPLYLSAGKMYVPFGHFESSMVSDPLTLEMGETGESAVQIGFESRGFYGSVYGFNGDINELGEGDDHIGNFGLNGGCVFDHDVFSLDLGLAYISNIGDTDGIGDFLDSGGHGLINDYVGGLAAHGAVAMGGLVVVAEYVTALDDFEPGEVAFKDGGAEPKAYQLELAYSTVFMQRVTILAVGYQATEEAVAFGLPESRYLGTLSMEFLASTALAFEYLHAKDYSRGDGGTGQDADRFTLQLALGF